MPDVHEDRRPDLEQEYSRLILGNDKGEELAFIPVLTFAIEKKEYIVLQPEGEGGNENLVILGFHAGANDEMIFDDITDDAEYEYVSKQAEAILNGEVETDEYIVDNDLLSEEELFEMRQREFEESQEDEEYCYEDENGRLFVFDDDGKPVYLDEEEDEKNG